MKKKCDWVHDLRKKCVKCGETITESSEQEELSKAMKILALGDTLAEKAIKALQDGIQVVLNDNAEKDKRIAMLRAALTESIDAADIRDEQNYVDEWSKVLQATAADVEEWFEKVKSDERKKVYAKIDREETESIAYCIGSKAGHFVEGGRCQTCKKDWIPKSRIPRESD